MENPLTGFAPFARAMALRRYRAGQLVAASGSPANDLILITRGRMVVLRSTPTGRRQVVRTLGPGEFFGVEALFARDWYRGDLVAVEASEVSRLPRAAFHSLLVRPPLGREVVQYLVKKIDEAEGHLADIGLHDVRQRLAAELARLATQDGILTPCVRVRVPWTQIALRLNTTPETLSRHLRAFAGEGIIRRPDTRTVVIEDPRRLRRLSDN